VPVGVLAPSQPYVYSPLTVVLGEKARGRKISGIGDLAGLRIAIESGTLADAILMTFEKGRLIDDISISFQGGRTCSARSTAANPMRHCST
jgi:ABC-type amino acid transport substrate-binding protein